MSKISRKEGNRVACLIKKNKAEYYITDVNISSKADLISTLNSTIKTLGKFKSAFTLIGASKEEILVLCYVPDENRFSSQEWIEACSLGITGIQEKDSNYCVFVGIVDFPFKVKDIIRGNGFAFLNKKGCMEDESESEEFIGFDDI